MAKWIGSSQSYFTVWVSTFCLLVVSRVILSPVTFKPTKLPPPFSSVSPLFSSVSPAESGAMASRHWMMGVS